MIAVYVAAFPAGGFVPLPRDSGLSGPHASTSGHGGTPYPLTRVLSPFSTGLGCSYSSYPSRGTHLERSYRADLAFGFAGTLYGYTSILREPGGHPLGGRDGFACGEPLQRWGQRFVHLSVRRIRRLNVNPVQPIEQTTIDSNGVGASHRPALPGLRFLRSEASASADRLHWPLTVDGAVAQATVPISKSPQKW